MRQTIRTNKAGVRLLLALALAVGLIAVLGVGLGLAAQRLPDEAAVTAVDAPFVPLAAAGDPIENVTGTAKVKGSFDFEYTWNLNAGLWKITVKRDYAPYTATVTVTPSQRGLVTVTGKVTVTGNIPTTVAGGTPNSLNVPVTGTASFTASQAVDVPGPVTIIKKGYAPVSGTFVVNVPVKGNVYVKSLGNLKGSGPVEGTLYSSGGWIFLPVIQKVPVTLVNFYDNFDDCDNWTSGSSNICDIKCTGGVMRVTTKLANEECVIPGFGVPAVIDGEFSIELRRTTSTNDHLMYTMFFGQTGADMYEDSYRVEVWPDREAGEKNVELWAFDDGSNVSLKKSESEELKSGVDKWNDLKITRDGSDINVYINDDKDIDADDEYHRNKVGYFALRVVSFSDEDVVVEFDDFRIVDGTTE